MRCCQNDYCTGKYGSVFLLRGDPAAAGGVFTYSEYPLTTASRSGHSVHLAGGSTLVVLGGRDDQMVETHSVVEKVCDDEAPPPRCRTMVELSRRIAAAATSSSSSSSSKPVNGRKHHASAYGAGVVFMHGGWTFDGRSVMV